jgi:hypothetical protein
MHDDDVVFIPASKAVLVGSYEVHHSGKKLSKCKVDVYQWDPKAKTFTFTEALSRRLKPDWCASAAKSALKPY